MNNANKILENISEKDNLTMTIKILTTIYLVMNTIRLGIELHEKVV